jgi:hypothetical protein
MMGKTKAKIDTRSMSEKKKRNQVECAASPPDRERAMSGRKANRNRTSVVSIDMNAHPPSLPFVFVKS